ncbi:hypothetical protein NPIL_161962, partial [Nephila pilipes]
MVYLHHFPHHPGDMCCLNWNHLKKIMENQTSQDDAEINKEKLVIIKDELRRLSYEMKKKEVNRNSTHAKMQQYIRQQ